MTRRYILAAPALACFGWQAAVKITFEHNVYRVTGWQGQEPDEGWSSVFSVFAGDSPDSPAMLGSYAIENGALTFRPRFSVSPGVRTRAVFRAPGGAMVEAVFDGSREKAQSTTVVQQVYPSGDVVPANLLRLYVQFSAPMQRGRAWEHIRLLGHDAKPLELPFLEVDQELWDSETRRLTVLFDPGRIKRGVLPREQVGTALVEGGSYTLVIDAGWRDARNAPLASEFRKRYRVAPEARKGIDLSMWRVQAPQAGTRDPLVIDFPAPLDYALLQRLVRVQYIPGTITVGAKEMQWRLVPDSAWVAGSYNVHVDTALEDVAGNRVGRPFDVDTFDPITPKLTRKNESISFRVRP